MRRNWRPPERPSLWAEPAKPIPDGRKSPQWKTYSQQLTDAGLDAFKAARNRNLADLTKINARLLTACESCHKEFKPESPTEGRVHDPE
jgi:hypothetical protein